MNRPRAATLQIGSLLLLLLLNSCVTAPPAPAPTGCTLEEGRSDYPSWVLGVHEPIEGHSVGVGSAAYHEATADQDARFQATERAKASLAGLATSQVNTTTQLSTTSRSGEATQQGTRTVHTRSRIRLEQVQLVESWSNGSCLWVRVKVANEQVERAIAQQDQLQARGSVVVIRGTSQLTPSEQSDLVVALLNRSLSIWREAECRTPDHCFERAREEGVAQLLDLEVNTGIEKGQLGMEKRELAVMALLWEAKSQQPLVKIERQTIPLLAERGESWQEAIQKFTQEHGAKFQPLQQQLTP